MTIFKNHPFRRIALGVMILSGLSATALACPGGQGGGQGEGQGMRRSPPPEALTACSGVGENQACQFEAPHGTVSGTCRNIQDQMACVPEGGPGGGAGGQGGPPQGGQLPQGA